jgi:hypothetical protein
MKVIHSGTSQRSIGEIKHFTRVRPLLEKGHDVVGKWLIVLLEW